jgi:hypothetical protein
MRSGEERKRTGVMPNLSREREMRDYRDTASVTSSSTRLRRDKERAQLIAQREATNKRYELQRRELELQRELEKIRLEEEIMRLQVEEIIVREEHGGASPVLPQARGPSSSDFVAKSDLRQLVDALRAPKVEISKFTGDPMCYHKFVMAFRENVEEVVQDPSARLSHLCQFTEGKAREVVDSYMRMGDMGYERARAALKERFGRPFVIAQAWIKRLTSAPNVRVQ